MLKKHIVDEQHEQIRNQVRELPDEQRKVYYQLSEQKLKDPDTYATLNYIFIAGLHHFYLNKWLFGILNIAVFWGGVIFLVIGQTEVGMTLIIGITLFELFELFQSQIIVKDYNNKQNQSILNDLLKDTPGQSIRIQ